MDKLYDTGSYGEAGRSGVIGPIPSAITGNLTLTQPTCANNSYVVAVAVSNAIRGARNRKNAIVGARGCRLQQHTS